MIPKANGKLRRLGIATITDRVVQASMKLVLEPIFEADFDPCSYGFRPNRRVHDAIAEVRFYATHSYEWIVEGDITACFDETAYLRATGQHPTIFATGIADLTPARPARLLDVIEGRSGAMLVSWLCDRDPEWRAGVGTASLDPFRGYASALATHLPAATRVLDPFHGVKLGLASVDDVRRRVQQRTTGHRGRTRDPL